MKTIKIFFLLIGISVSSLLYAQDGHLKCAPGCVYAQQLQGKNTVSCIDRVCSICHEKLEKERKEKLEADKLAAQKRAQQAEQRKQQQTKLIADQKKQVAIQREKITTEKNRLREEAIKTKERLAQLNLDKNDNKKSTNNKTLKGYREDVTTFSTKDSYGLISSGDTLFSNKIPNEMKFSWEGRIDYTNYFLIRIYPKKTSFEYFKTNNSLQIVSLTGKIINVGDYNIFNEVTELDGTVLLKHCNGVMSKSHDKRLDPDWIGMHKVRVYNSKEDLITVHEALIEAYSADFQEKYAGQGGMILTRSPYTLFSGNGVVIETDLTLKVIQKNEGLIFTYY